jgi:hypothetical protein
MPLEHLQMDEVIDRGREGNSKGRVYCRNLKCRAKLEIPVSNPREDSARDHAGSNSIAIAASTASGRCPGMPSIKKFAIGRNARRHGGKGQSRAGS